MSAVQLVISLVSGILGAGIALLGQHLVSKRSSEMEMKTTVLTVFLPARLSAYKDYISSLRELAEKRDPALCREIYHAANAASLVASEKTIQAIAAVQKFIEAYEKSGEEPKGAEFEKAKITLLSSMHNDLVNYHAPDIKLEK